MSPGVFVHRSVGKVNYVTCDVVMGQQGATGRLIQLLDRLDPDTLVLDLSVQDADGVARGKVDDPFLKGLAEAVEDVAEEPPLQPYEEVLAWATHNQAELRPVGPRSSFGWVQGRRVRKVLARVEQGDPEARARKGMKELLDDDVTQELAKRRRRDLADSLENVLNQEPPRTVAIFAFPWGEQVSSDVRRAMGLHRADGEQLAGGWPA